METFGFMFSLLIPFGTLAIIIFAIAAIMEGKNTMKKGSVIRTLYFYLTSLITLAIVVGSLIFLINLGLKVWVFPQADQGYETRFGSPPSLYMNAPTAAEPTKSVPIETTTGLECQDTCTLTDTQKTNIETWKTNYKNWQEQNANPGARRARDAVAGFSFLIVALPFFIIHFRIVQKDAKQSADDERSVIRPTYFYFVSLASLIMMVVAGGFLINIVLKTWVFPEAGKADDLQTAVYPADVTATEKASVQSIVTCGEKCGIDEETITLAKQWGNDYDNWQKQVSRPASNKQRQAAASIPFVAVGIPLFWYHWSVVRREARERKMAGMDNNGQQ